MPREIWNIILDKLIESHWQDHLGNWNFSSNPEWWNTLRNPRWVRPSRCHYRDYDPLSRKMRDMSNAPRLFCATHPQCAWGIYMCFKRDMANVARVNSYCNDLVKNHEEWQGHRKALRVGKLLFDEQLKNRPFDP